MSAILSWNHVSFSYNSQQVVRNFSHELSEADFCVFVGPNGSGKTTLFKLAVGVVRPDQGSITLNGRNLSDWQATERARMVTYLEQEIQYVFPFTVEEVVMMGRFPHTEHHFWDRHADLETAVWAMERVGILKFAKKSIYQLSSGERRKVDIARALCQKPKLLLLDEPSTFLDIRQQVDLIDTLLQLNHENNVSIGLISHQLSMLRHHAKSAILMKQGAIERVGKASDLLSQNSIADFFDIRNKALV